MPVVFCGVCPHPPIMVPAVGKKDADKVLETRRSMLELGGRLKESGAETLVMISPHGPVFRDAVAINMFPAFSGNLNAFGAPQAAVQFENDLPLAAEISRRSQAAGIMTVEMDKKSARLYRVSPDQDHGLTVPLYFLREAGVQLKLVPVYMGFLAYEQLYSFGVAMQQAVDRAGIKVAVIASGDMSHRLIPGAPAGYNEMGKKFDHKLVRLLEQADVPGVMGMDPELIENAGECGLRPVIMMLGSLDGYAVESEVLSYQGPFGVGYLVASLRPVRADEGRRFQSGIAEKHRVKIEEKKKNESFLPALARKVLEHYSRGEKFSLPATEIPEEFKKPAGVFVSLKEHGQLRGCIGTIEPRYENVVQETINNAVSAGHHDPRFSPVRPEELDDLDISVDVLSPPEKIKSKEDLDPLCYGVIVRSGRKSGLLLPNLEGVDTVEEQISIAMQKAGITPGEPYELERFEVVRHK